MVSLPRIRRLSRYELSENGPSSSDAHAQQVRAIKIEGRGDIWSVASLVGHIVSGGKEGKIRCLRVEDGEEEGAPMDVRSPIGSIAVSRDGKLIVSGTISGFVTVWNAEDHRKVTEFRAHRDVWVRAVDVFPDGTRLATGSDDSTACVWSLEDGRRLLPPLQHDAAVVAVKLSGSLLATATLDCYSTRIYNSSNGQLLVNVSIKVSSRLNQSLAWTSDSKELFVLSYDGTINRLDVSTGTTRSQWRIHSSDRPTCIALAKDGTFIAASANSSVSLWDVTTHQQIGQIIQDNHFVQSMTISPNLSLATAGGKTVTLRSLCDIDGPNKKIKDLEKTVQELNLELDTSQRAKDELNKTVHFLRINLRAQRKSSNHKIEHLSRTVQKLRKQLADSQHRTDSLDQTIYTHEQRHECEALYADGRIVDAAASLLVLMNTVSEEANQSIKDWLLEFKHRCISKLEVIGDEASSSDNRDEAIVAYSTALSLGYSTQNTLLNKWASMTLTCGLASKALDAASKFKLPKFIIYQAICDVLEGGDRVAEAIECFRQMRSKPPQDPDTQWQLDFRRRCVEKLVKLGDTEMDHNTAIQQYSDALMLDPPNQGDILLKRSKTRSLMGSWEEALLDADKVIELDPSSYKGYERKHVALHGMERYSEAFAAFKLMLSKLEQSHDPHIRELLPQFVDATLTIRRVIDETVKRMPRVLINTATGRLYDRIQQTVAFDQLPIYNEMRSSMTTRLDHARIQREVEQYYRYVMLSHTWQHGEPLFQMVENISIYELESSPPNIKLQTFCKLSRSLEFDWVWSDTCCIDRKDAVGLQESLVAMFTWYRGSSLTIVYLLGVLSQSQRPGDLRESIWNARAWPYQEYVAAETIQFYTEDWKPYLGLDMFNHKKSPTIISEMQHAVELAVLRPGLERVREKLYLASERQTTLVEDVAYSLLGIFNASIPIIYGEGDRAVGRLLEHILTGSGDLAILAWTGRSGSYNSCLPVDLGVFNELVPPHIPRRIEAAEMDRMVATLRSSLPDLSLVENLHVRLNELPPPSLTASRLRLPAIIFRLTELVRTSDPGSSTNLRGYRATTSTFGDTEIWTADDLTGMKDLYLVHPWIRPLLCRVFLPGEEATIHRTTKALQILAYLRQPFGALLFEWLSHIEYRRVAADSLIIVRVREEVPLTDFINNICIIEVQ